MAHFDDLSEYRYSRRVQPGVVHVGWLGNGHPYARGAVPASLVEKMRRLARSPVELYRGFHVCDLCVEPEEVRRDRTQKLHAQKDPKNWNSPMRDFMSQLWEDWAKSRISNGEIRVTRNGITYAAPILITHYIEVHGYCPPGEFLRAIEEAVEPVDPGQRP